MENVVNCFKQNAKIVVLFFLAPKHVARKYCSSTCARVKNRGKISVICANCSTVFNKKISSLKNSKSGLFFCSRACKDNAQRMGNYSEILRPKHYKDGRYSYRNIAFRYHPKICNRCGYCEYPGILKVHHKDRNRKNNDFTNLEVLCPNCHDLEHYLKKDGTYSGGKRGRSVSVNTSGLQPEIGS